MNSYLYPLATLGFVRRLVLISIIAALSIVPTSLKATHIVGGELYYKKMAGENYEITLVIYRDCDKGIPDFDYPAYIGVFDAAGTRIRNIAMYAHTVDTIPLSINDSCTLLNSSVCYEIGTYQAIESLPYIPGGYTLVYDRCCWNSSVLNIISPLESGITITTSIPDSAKGLDNSSPFFNYRTPPFLCAGYALEFDHSATDLDGDSLVYELFTPLNTKQGLGSEGPPPSPPYLELIYRSPYSLANVMGGDPLEIDPKTGWLRAVPSTIGQFIFGIRVNEYRNDEWIGSTTRSYQLNIQPCQRVTEAIFPSPIIQCGDSLVNFENRSFGASNFLWHFGDTTSIDSISNSPTPSHVYSGNGTYTATLVAISDKSPVCNDTATGTVSLYPEMTAEFNWEDDKCVNYVQFRDLTSTPSGPITKWKWYFGNLATSNAKDPYIQLPLKVTPTSIPVSLVLRSEAGCEDSVTKIYTGVDKVFEIQDAGATKGLLFPRNDSTVIFVEASGGVSYEWSPQKGLTDPNAPTTYASPNQDVVYHVIVTDERGCMASANVRIEVLEYVCGEDEVYIPNAFSPNGDGENDFFRIRGEGITALQLSVYNRWGEMVFTSEDINMIQDPSLGWDGRHHGSLQDPGVFVYYLKARCSEQFEFTKQGNVTLLR